MGQVFEFDGQKTRQNAAGGAAMNPVDAYLGRLGNGSRRGIRIALQNIARIASNGQSDPDTFSWASLRYEDTAAIRKAIAERFSRATANLHLCALRGILKECWRLELVSHADYARAVDVKQVRGDDHAAGRVLTEAELVALFKACEADLSAAGVRDGAIIAVLYSTGVRRTELVSLNVADYGDGVLTVRGKGSIVRLAYLVAEAKQMMERWLQLRGGTAGALFVSINKGGRIGTGRLIGESVHRVLLRRAEEAAIEPFSPHDLRRTCATHLLERGIDIAVVRQMLGHRHLSTTILYDRRGEAAKKTAANALKV